VGRYHRLANMADSRRCAIGAIMRLYPALYFLPSIYITFTLDKFLCMYCSLDERERWLREVKDSMKEVVAENVGREDKHVYMKIEGIVGRGWKGRLSED
jgi:hypothetical protein